MTLSPRSVKNLQDVHPDLVRVVFRAAEASTIDFVVIEGRRSVERQIQMIASGLSRIKVPEHGRHVTGHAVDLCVVRDGVARWDTPTYRMLAAFIKGIAEEEQVPIRWGGDFGEGFFDGPHFELPADKYPADSDPLRQQQKGQVDVA